MYMVMSWNCTGNTALTLFCALLTGQARSLAGVDLQGAQDGIGLTISIGGAICLWSGLGRLMEKAGILTILSRLLMPLLHRLFPSARKDPALARNLSANICANFLGLGNAATPMGISAAKGLRREDSATDELCRLIVLNTASIQLIPTNVAAIRSSLGCTAPFDLLPAGWITSACSAGLGLAAAYLLGRVWEK